MRVYVPRVEIPQLWVARLDLLYEIDVRLSLHVPGAHIFTRTWKWGSY
jgi:hypothetical protein